MTPPRKIPRLEGGSLDLPQIYIGGAPWWLQFNSAEHLASEEPYKVVLEAFRSGLNCVDLGPLYAQSESIVGKVLGDPNFRQEWPRDSYTLITKCGRYGTELADFDYSPDRIRKSIANSQKLLHSEHFDVVYLHDVEFIADDPGHACAGGFTLEALEASNLAEYGLAPEQADKVWDQGDETVLEAVKTLFELKDAGTIRNVGISALPLPTLLRLARLIKARLGRSLDILQSYAHLTVQNESLCAYIPLLKAAGVKQIVNASPISMGLLVKEPAKSWHPAPEALQKATTNILPDQTKVSLRYGLRAGLKFGVPTVIGVSSVKELHEAIEAFWEGENMSPAQEKDEQTLRQSIMDAGYRNFIWPSPPNAKRPGH